MTTDQDSMDTLPVAPVSNIEIIPERDMMAISDPTNVWLLQPDSLGNYKLYEQWEKMRRFKAKAVYTSPDGDIFYLKNADDPFGVHIEDTNMPLDSYNELDLAPERPGSRYCVAVDDTIWSIALSHKVVATKLMEHNEIANPEDIRVGQWLYIPPSHEAKERSSIEYRLLETPRQMHVSHIGGTTKYSFGGVKKWADIKSELKQYEENHNVDIHAIAKVPVESTVAAYYMDKHDLGTYKETGRVAYTRGYNWQHLAEGHITVEKPASKVAQVVASAMMEDDRPALPDKLEIAPAVEPEPVVEETTVSPLEVELDDYKSTFKYLNFEESPEQFRLLDNMEIRELDGAQLPIQRKADSKVMVSGWFMYKGTPYYRVATRYWYAIPTQLAYSVEDEAFNGIAVDLPTRVAHNLTLSREERQVVMMSKAVAKYNKVRGLSGIFRR